MEFNIPQELDIYLTEKCNLDCRYCYRHKKEEDVSEEINFSDFKNAIDIFLDTPGPNKGINFTGGEPFLRYLLFKNICKYSLSKAKKRKINLVISVTTNGVFLDKVKSSFLKENSIDCIVSLDGEKAINDYNRRFATNGESSAFEAVRNKLKFFNADGLKVSSVFTPHTLNSLKDSINFLQSIGISRIDLFPDLFADWEDEQLENIKKSFTQLKGKYLNRKTKSSFSLCPSYVNRFLNNSKLEKECEKIILSADGNFYVCDKVFSLPEQFRKQFIVGNIEEGINFNKRNLILSKIKDDFSKQTKNKCGCCSIKKYCFCPIGIYLYYKFTKKDFSKHFKNFCTISKIYYNTFFEHTNLVFN